MVSESGVKLQWLVTEVSTESLKIEMASIWSTFDIWQYLETFLISHLWEL
jgi:hypothetical protein